MTDNIEVNKCEYKYTKLIELQEEIYRAGGFIPLKELLTMTFEDFFRRLPQNGVTVNFKYDKKFKDEMQNGKKS
jgi:hypothetical protein